MAPSLVQQRTMSRTEMIPLGSPASTTTRWRKRPRTIATAACSSDQSGAANTSSPDWCEPAGSESTSWPWATECRMSRSVRMPGPAPSGSITTAEPTLRLAIRPAAWRSVCPGPMVRTILLIASGTCMKRITPTDLADLATIGSSVSNVPIGASTRQLWRVGILQVILFAVRCVSNYVPTQRSSTIRLRTSLFQEAAEIVDREFAAELSRDDIARRVASSRRQLQRAYAEIGQTTFRDHLTQVRMQKAAEMLATRTLTVREVAHRVGYRQPAQFAKAFRRYQGMAPSDFRANGRPNAAMRSGAGQFAARPVYRAA